MDMGKPSSLQCLQGWQPQGREGPDLGRSESQRPGRGSLRYLMGLRAV